MNAPRRFAVIEALRREQCRFPIRMELGAMTLLPHLAELKPQAQIFRIESLVASDRHQNDAAIDALEHVLLTANLLKDEPILISQLVRIACVMMALDGAEHLLSRTALTPAQLDRLQRLFESSRLEGALRRAFVGERAFALNAFELSGETLAAAGPSDGDDPVDPDTEEARYRKGMTVFRVIGIESIDRRLMLETLNEAVALTEKDTPEAWKRLAELFDEAAAKARGFPPKIFSRLLLPALSKAGNKFAQLEARRRAGLAAIGVERYRSARGQLPQGLDELTPEFLASVPADPFDAKPLRFRQRPVGFVVYSIGVDRTDDGGAERPRKGPVKNFDVTFVVER